MTNEEAILIISQIKCIITNNNSWSDSAKAAAKEAFDLAIKALEERPQGEWIDCGEYYKCPFCGNWVLEVDGKPNYCDECGAKLKGGAE